MIDNIRSHVLVSLALAVSVISLACTPGRSGSSHNVFFIGESSMNDAVTGIYRALTHAG